eukprot:scaffold117601_cov22-Tisochrysis_lutea.AAC.1
MAYIYAESCNSLLSLRFPLKPREATAQLCTQLQKVEIVGARGVDDGSLVALTRSCPCLRLITLKSVPPEVQHMLSSRHSVPPSDHPQGVDSVPPEVQHMPLSCHTQVMRSDHFQVILEMPQPAPPEVQHMPLSCHPQGVFTAGIGGKQYFVAKPGQSGFCQKFSQ